MKRVLAALLGFAAVSAWAERPRVDLSRPGALDRLAAESPDTHSKVAAILRAAERPPCENAESRALKASHELKSLQCGFLLYTSYPAKRYVDFVLDEVAYSARVSMAMDGRIIKAQGTR